MARSSLLNERPLALTALSSFISGFVFSARCEPSLPDLANNGAVLETGCLRRGSGFWLRSC